MGAAASPKASPNRAATASAASASSAKMATAWASSPKPNASAKSSKCSTKVARSNGAMPLSNVPASVTARAATPPSLAVPRMTNSSPAAARKLRANPAPMNASPRPSMKRPVDAWRIVANSVAGFMPRIWAPKVRSRPSTPADTKANAMPRRVAARTPGCSAMPSRNASAFGTVLRGRGSSW